MVKSFFYPFSPSQFISIKVLLTLFAQIKLKKVKWCIYTAPFPYECSKALYNDQFTHSGPEAYIGASGSRFEAVHVCWYSFYRPREDGKLSKLWREIRSPKYSSLDQAGDRTAGPQGWEGEILPLRLVMRIEQMITHSNLSKMKNKILPICLQGNYRDGLGEFNNKSYGVLGAKRVKPQY